MIIVDVLKVIAGGFLIMREIVAITFSVILLLVGCGNKTSPQPNSSDRHAGDVDAFNANSVRTNTGDFRVLDAYAAHGRERRVIPFDMVCHKCYTAFMEVKRHAGKKSKDQRSAGKAALRHD